MKLLYMMLVSTTLMNLSVMPVFAEKLAGEVLYTQVNMYSFRDRLVTWANYNVDTLIPVNTAIIIKPNTGDKVYFAIQGSATRLALKNSIISGLSGKEWLAKHAAKTKVSLAALTNTEQTGIKNAKVLVGMRKKAVMIARGFPPKSLTPNLTSPNWVYWRNRKDQETVSFKNDKVVRISD